MPLTYSYSDPTSPGVDFATLPGSVTFPAGAGTATVNVTPQYNPSRTNSLTVTVTAQKRTENVKDIPMSVSVVGGKQLEKQHILDYTDLARTVPILSGRCCQTPAVIPG